MTRRHVVEVLTGRAPNAYKAFLRSLGISYIIGGDDELDFALVLDKLNSLFGIDCLMLGGGGVLNWPFIQQGLCDEVSVVLCPAADGSAEAPTLFEVREGLSTDDPVGFALENVRQVDGDVLWLRYHVKNRTE